MEQGNKTKEKIKNFLTSPVKIFCCISLIMLSILGIFLWSSRGNLVSSYFFYDERDTFMDFFHSIEYVRGRMPYVKFETLYPPLANLFFYILYLFIPQNIAEQWADTFIDSVYMVGTSLDLRTYQAPLLLFVLTVVFSIWMFTSLVSKLLKNIEGNFVVSFCLLLSPGMLYAIERGNILFFLLPFSLFFIMYYLDDRIWLRELAMIALTIAAGMKLYPAFLGILLLRDKEFKQAFRLVVYGILSVILPLFVFEEKLNGLTIWLSVLFRFASKNDNPWIGTGFTNILHRVSLYINRYLGIEVPTEYFGIVTIIILLLLLIVAIKVKKNWISILSITMAMILFQSQGQYIFCYMALPMLFFLKEETKISYENIIPFSMMTILCINIPLFYEQNISNPNIVIEQLCCLVIVIWLLGNGLKKESTRKYSSYK